MNRETDPVEEAKDFTQERTNTCAAHQWFAKMIQDLTVTVMGNGSVESKEGSLLGIVSSVRTTLKVNGRWLRGLVALMIALFLAMIIPAVSWIQTSGRVLKQIEINTILIQEHDRDIKELKTVSYGYQDKHKAVANVGVMR